MCFVIIAMLTVACTRTDRSGSTENVQTMQEERHEIDGLEWQESVPLTYATGFSIEHYKDGFRLITVSDGSQFLIVPNGLEAPQGLKNDIRVIKQPVTNLYLAATAVMDMFRSLNAIDTIKLSGTDADGWYIEEAKQAMERGELLYAGKYNIPDYELILSQGCQLAIENTMILHTPEVKEQLKTLGIPVLIDHASNEAHPLGRVEWIKLYGALLGKEDAAERIFDEQQKAFAEIEKNVPQGDKTVAFFT